MNKLFIIGNGFDFAVHKFRTTYTDFKHYLENQYPNAIWYGQIPRVSSEGEYDINEVVGFIYEIMNRASGKEWNSLEDDLGEETLYLNFDDEIAEFNFEEDDDSEIFHGLYNQEDDCSNIAECFPLIKDLFYDWVNHELGKIDYNDAFKPEISAILGNDNIYLNFKYTLTLEKTYNIPSNNINHIHGKVGDSKDKIIFGHNNKNDLEECNDFIPRDLYYNELKNNLKKPVEKIIDENRDFFKKLACVTDVYTYGFSFSETDKLYINEIKSCLSTKSVTWHFNVFDWNNKMDIIETLTTEGYNIVQENW